MENATFILNGREITAAYEGRMTLLKYLRNVECMTGSKEGCSTGHCGACSVLIDGILARSCVTVLKTLAGKSVETIENLPNDTIPEEIVFDAQALEVGSEVFVKDLALPEGVTAVTDADLLVLHVEQPKEEAEAAPAETEENTEVEVVAKGKAAKEE